MASLSRFYRITLAGSAAAALAASLPPAPAAAQSAGSDDRVRRLEAEVRALQRAVFPGGDGRYFEPEITPSQSPPATPQIGTPADSAMSDVLARLSAIESQLARLTAASEVNANALEQLEQRANTGDAALATADQPTGVIPLPDNAATGSGAPADGSSGELAPVSPAPPVTAGAATNAASNPTPARLAAVQAISKPATDDAGDDEYTYGFRLWEAGYYPEAQQQLALFLERYPNHARASFGRNLLGRAYLDAGNPRVAANYFLENYQADKQSARAPDSLLYLAESMVALGDTSRACIALAEFGDNYPALATGRLQQQYDADRSKVTCS